MKKLVLSFLFCTLGVGIAHAAGYQLVLVVSGQNCTDILPSGILAQGISVNSWSWGASDSTSGSNGGPIKPGKNSLQNLSVSRITDKCSSDYLHLSLTGMVSSTVTLTQYQNNGEGWTPSMVVTLGNAIVSSYQISGSTGGGDPYESLSFAFQKICIENKINNTRACWNASTNAPYSVAPINAP
jgi:type VI secretion system secreted protein Hcp